MTDCNPGLIVCQTLAYSGAAWVVIGLFLPPKGQIVLALCTAGIAQLIFALAMALGVRLAGGW